MSDLSRDSSFAAPPAVREILGQDLIGADGERIGEIGQVFVDDDTGEPAWVTVRTSLPGLRQNFVPLARLQVRGSRLVTPFSRHVVENAPTVDDDTGRLSIEQEAEVYRYYGLDFRDQAGSTGPGTSVRGGLKPGTTPERQGQARILLTEPELVERRRALIEKANRKMTAHQS